MYKNILFISDNLLLCERIKNIISHYSHLIDSYSFAISPYSDLKCFSEKLLSNVSEYNLKNEDDIEKIIENYDLVISIHCKQLFPKKLVQSTKCINLHPGYNPINRGWYPQVFAILYDLPVGATIHEIDEELDHGPIIDRAFVLKSNSDTSGSLYDKIIEKEIELFENNIEKIILNQYKTIIPEEEGNLFLKKDFNKLCHINLNEEVNTNYFIKKLRALTHHHYKNAFYIDDETNQKVFISLNIDNKYE